MADSAITWYIKVNECLCANPFEYAKFLFFNQSNILFTGSPKEYVLDLVLDKGGFSGYRLLLDKKNLEDHRRNPFKWWYQEGGCQRFLEVLIPDTFRNSKCICPSNHDKRIRCMYSIYQSKPKGPDYLKICFATDEKGKRIFITTYNVFPTIAENLCRKLI